MAVNMANAYQAYGYGNTTINYTRHKVHEKGKKFMHCVLTITTQYSMVRTLCRSE